MLSGDLVCLLLLLLIQRQQVQISAQVATERIANAAVGSTVANRRVV